MRRLLTTLMLAFVYSLTFAQNTITVTATNGDISDGLDLALVAKLFASSQNIEDFEILINNPDSMYCNLDMNADGIVDYIRVVETGEGNERLIVLQAILAKDIYQDVASIYVEKQQNNSITVQVIGDEYVYGSGYVIEPVYIYRPVIYSWLFSPYWRVWYSPYYWGYYPYWWHSHHCWLHHRYWDHCHWYHRHHHYCSFRHHHEPTPRYHTMRSGVSHRDYSSRHPDNSFNRRNAGVTNARDLRNPNNRGGGSVRGRESTRTTTQQRPTTVRSTTNQTVSSRTSTSTTRQGNVTTTRTTTTTVSSRQGNGHRSGSVHGERTTTQSTRSGSSTRVSSGSNSSRGGGSSVSRKPSGGSRSGGSVSRQPSGGSRSGGSQRVGGSSSRTRR